MSVTATACEVHFANVAFMSHVEVWSLPDTKFSLHNPADQGISKFQSTVYPHLMYERIVVIMHSKLKHHLLLFIHYLSSRKGLSAVF